jgi:hypothetical protein
MVSRSGDGLQARVSRSGGVPSDPACKPPGDGLYAGVFPGLPARCFGLFQQPPKIGQKIVPNQITAIPPTKTDGR